MKTFLISLLDPKGQISFGRTAALLTLVFCLGWDTSSLVFAWGFNHHLPAGMNPLPLLPDASTLIGQGSFAGLFFGITKAGDMKKIGVDGSSSEEVELKKG